MLTSSVSYLIVRFISLRLIDKSPDLITYTRTSACVPPRSGTATPTRPTRALSCRFTAGRSDECRADMGSFGEMLWILHSVGIYAQISANLAVDNHVSGNALFTEVPRDVVSQPGDDVEMSCSFRGSSSSSSSLEIQWCVKRSDEGTYECRVIDFSESQTQRYRVQAYLQVQQKIHINEQKEEEKTSGIQHEEDAARRVHHQPHERNKTRAGNKHPSETQ
ncbi:V-set and transmembrane domain-containing protein 2-like protein [Pimephales promelas]|nr:V-set and transmembrane domain-containing protein 2-like protein [Pimephales promelas]